MPNDYEPDLEEALELDDEEDVVTVALTDEQLEAVHELKHVRAEAALLAKRNDALRKELLQVIGSAGAAVTASGAPAITVRRTSRRGVDAKALEAKYPDVFDEVLKETEIVTLDLT